MRHTCTPSHTADSRQQCYRTPFNGRWSTLFSFFPSRIQSHSRLSLHLPSAPTAACHARPQSRQTSPDPIGMCFERFECVSEWPFCTASLCMHVCCIHPIHEVLHRSCPTAEDIFCCAYTHTHTHEVLLQSCPAQPIVIPRPSAREHSRVVYRMARARAARL